MPRLWRYAANDQPLNTPPVTPRTGRRVVARAFERGPETRAVASGEAGIPGFQAQLASPTGTAAPDWTATRADQAEPPGGATPTTGAPDWWSR